MKEKLKSLAKYADVYRLIGGGGQTTKELKEKLAEEMTQCKASEAKVKRIAVKELIAGEWYALADYNGVPCRFQMFPVEEMLLFRKYLSDGLYPEALKSIDKLLGNDRKAEFVKGDAEREILVQSGPYQDPEEKFYIEASKMIHQYDALVSGDAGSGADENASLDGLSEDEEEVQ